MKLEDLRKALQDGEAKTEPKPDCHRCHGSGVIKSTIGDAPCPICYQAKPNRNANRRGFPAAMRCVRCKTTKHVQRYQVSLGDGRVTGVRLCRECEEKKPVEMDDVFSQQDQT